jgi:hypothetical protein
VQKLANNSTRTYFPMPAPDATEIERAISTNFSDEFTNGTKVV